MALESAVKKIAAILSPPQCVKCLTFNLFVSAFLRIVFCVPIATPLWKLPCYYLREWENPSITNKPMGRRPPNFFGIVCFMAEAWYLCCIILIKLHSIFLFSTLTDQWNEQGTDVIACCFSWANCLSRKQTNIFEHGFRLDSYCTLVNGK